MDLLGALPDRNKDDDFLPSGAWLPKKQKSPSKDQQHTSSGKDRSPFWLSRQLLFLGSTEEFPDPWSQTPYWSTTTLPDKLNNLLSRIPPCFLNLRPSGAACVWNQIGLCCMRSLVFDLLGPKRMQVLDLEPNLVLDLFHLGRTVLSQPPNLDLGLGELLVRALMEQLPLLALPRHSLTSTLLEYLPSRQRAF